LKFGLDEQAKEAGQGPDIHTPLIRAIKAGAPQDIVQVLLERGADPNRVYADFHSKYCVSPLSAAVLTGATDTFRLLLSKGAHINGRQLIGGRSAQARHLPIFAAAYSLARAQNAEAYFSAATMLRLCVESGADINAVSRLTGTRHGYFLYIDSRIRRVWLERDDFFEGTPLHVFIDAITLWVRKPKAIIQDFASITLHNEPGPRVAISTPTTTSSPDATDGLRLLLSLGAVANPVFKYNDNDLSGNLCSLISEEDKQAMPRSPQGSRMCLQPLSPLQLLITKWEPRSLVLYPSCATVVRLLIEAGGASNSHARLMSTFTIPIKCYAITPRDFQVLASKRMIADLVLADVPNGPSASRIFFTYVVDFARGGYLLDDTCRSIVERLIDLHGADVNSTFSEKAAGVRIKQDYIDSDDEDQDEDEEQHDVDAARGGRVDTTADGSKEKVTADDYESEDLQETTLHHVCRFINYVERMISRRYHGWRRYPIVHRTPTSHLNLLRLLLSKGADPFIAIETRYGRRTAIDALLEELDEMTEDSQEHLKGLAAILRGEDVQPVEVYRPKKVSWEA
jgi:hypothetical protein